MSKILPCVKLNGSFIYKIKALGISSSDRTFGSLLLKSSEVFTHPYLHLLKMFKGMPFYCLSSSSPNRVIATFQFVLTISLQLRLFASKRQLLIIHNMSRHLKFLPLLIIRLGISICFWICMNSVKLPTWNVEHLASCSDLYGCPVDALPIVKTYQTKNTSNITHHLAPII